MKLAHVGTGCIKLELVAVTSSGHGLVCAACPSLSPRLCLDQVQLTLTKQDRTHEHQSEDLRDRQAGSAIVLLTQDQRAYHCLRHGHEACGCDTTYLCLYFARYHRAVCPLSVILNVSTRLGILYRGHPLSTADTTSVVGKSEGPSANG